MKHKFKKFNDLAAKDINFDFHMHTNQTDGFCSAEEMIGQAVSLQLKAIAITEHVNKNSDWFDGFKKKIDALKQNKDIQLFLGIETKVENLKGEIDATKKMISDSDIVVGVVHRYPDGEKKEFLSFEQIKNIGFENSAKIEFDLSMALLSNKDIDILGHPFAICFRVFNRIPEDYLAKLMAESLKNKIAIEINTKYFIGNESFFDLFKKYNPYVSIGSDAHKKEEIARSFDIVRQKLTKK